MGHDITIVDVPVFEKDAEAWREVEAVSERHPVDMSRFSLLFNRLEERYPCPSNFSQMESKPSVWKNFPLRNTVSGAAAHLSINDPYATEVIPFLVAQSTALGMTVFDWTTRQVFRDGGFPGVSLDVESRPPLPSPTLTQVVEAVEALTPEGGPGFLIISGPGGDYVQVAGGLNRYTIECRRYRGEEFTHWIAGNPGMNSGRPVRLQTNGFFIEIDESEILKKDAIISIISTYLIAGRIDTAFRWNVRVL